MNNEKISLYIDSQHRDAGGLAEDFTITLGSSIKKIVQVEVISAEVPYTFYAITSSNNTICWTDTAPRASQIPVGNYTITGFILAIQNSMNAVSSGYTVTYSTTTYTITLSSANSFSLDVVNSNGICTIQMLIGLTSRVPSVPFGSTYIATPQGVTNISGPRYILIKSNALTRPKATRAFFNTLQDDILYKIPLVGGPGDILVEKNVFSNPQKFGVRQVLQKLDFQLTDDTGTVVNLNGQNWSLTINLSTG